MQITKHIRSLIFVFTVLAAVNLLFLGLARQAQADLERAYELRGDFVAFEHDFRMTSVQLSQSIHAFVVTGSDTQRMAFHTSIERLSQIYEDFVYLEPTANEMAIFRHALGFQDNLRALDALAIAAQRAGDVDRAQEILYGSQYNLYGISFLATLNQLNAAIFARTNSTIEHASSSSSLFNFFSGVSAILLAVVVIIGSYFVLRKAHITVDETRAAQELNDVILKHSPLVMNIWSKDLKLLQTSQQAVDIFKLSSQQEYLDRFSELSPEKQPCGSNSTKKGLDYIKLAFEKGGVTFEWIHQSLDGTPIPMEIKLMRFKRGEQELVAAYSTDLRTAKEAARTEEELRTELALNEEIQAALEAAPIAVNFYTSEFELVNCNTESVHLFGYSDKEAFIDAFSGRMSMFSLAMQPCGKTASEMIDDLKIKVQNQGRVKFNWTFVNLAGGEIPAEVSIVNVPNKTSFNFVMFIHDLREINAATVKEREASALNQIYLDSCPMFIEKWDDELNIIDCNETTLKLFGVDSKQEFLDNYSSFFPLFQPCGRTSTELCDEMVRKALKEGFSSFEFVHLTANGDELPVHVTNVRIKRGDSYIVVGYSHDLRQIKEAQEKQKQEIELNQAILDSAPFIISLWDEELNMVRLSKFATELFNVSAERLTEIKLYNYSPMVQPCGALTAQKAFDEMNKAFTQGHNRFSWTHIGADGLAIPAEVIARRFSYNDSNHVVTYTLDMREINRAMQQERDAHALTQTIFDTSPIVIGLWDENRKLLRLSDYASEMFGVDDPQEVVGNLRMFSPPYQPCGISTPEKINYHFEKALKYGYTRFEWTHLKATGEPMLTDIAYKVFEYRGEKMMVSYTLDITALNEAHEQASLMVETTPLACFIAKHYVDETGTLRFEALDCNRAAIELFGFLSKEEACMDFRFIFAKDQSRARAVRNEIFSKARSALMDGYTRFEHDNYHKDGSVIPCDITMVRVQYRGESVLACYLDDMREVKNMIKELRRIDVAEEENRAKTRFLARMSHEIRTPMNAVMGITDIELQKDHHPPETEEAFMRIHNSSNILLGIINDILDLSKADAGKMEILPTVYEISNLVVDTIQLNQVTTGNKPLALRLEIDENIPEHLIGDDLRIKQILNNLLSNAFKYTQEGEVVLRLSVYQDEPDEILLLAEVEDTGQGMTKEQVRNLFSEEYTRFNSEANRLIEGSGLGMMITQQLVNMMGGEVKAESVLDVGTVFIVQIPQRISKGTKPLGKDGVTNLQELKQLSTKRLRKTSREIMPYGRVLVVDDVESNLFVAKGILQPYKISVDVVSSGLEAIRCVENGEEYDIIFMDHMMPKMDGIEATKIIRELGYTKPILALTANALKGVSKMFLENGFDGFLSKPIDIERLDSFLTRFIKERRPAEEIEAARKEQASNLSELYDVFLIDANRARGIIASTLEKEKFDASDFKVYTTQVHAMRSALINIGQAGLSGFATSLEKHGLENDETAIRTNTPRFLEELDALIESINVASEEVGDDDIQDEDSEFVSAMLEELALACDDYDVEKAKEILATANEKKFSKKTRELLKEISNNLLFGDFDEAAALARRGK